MHPATAWTSIVLSLSLAQAAPPLVRIPLETYPPVMREPIARAYREASEHPGDGARTGALARLLHAWEQWGAAHDSYARAAALAGGEFEWRYLDACVLQRLARPAEAAVRLKEALAIRPGYLPARVKLADVLFEAGQREESRALFTSLSAEPAAEPEALFGLGRIAAADGAHDQAVRYIERALALFPEWGAARYSLALSLRALGRREEAQRELIAHARYGARWPAVDDRVLAGVMALRTDPAARLRRAQKLTDGGDVEAAIAEYESALAADPSLSAAHADLVKLYGRTRNWAKAEAHYREAVALGSSLADVHYDYGVLLGLQERWDEAADAYRRAIAINPLYADAYNNLGQILERKRDLDAALAAYRRAVEAQPTLRVARFNAGRMLIALNRPGEAIRMLEALSEPADADSARYVFALSVAFIRSGDKDAGLRWGTEARRRALDSGQRELAAAIDKEMATIR